MAFPRDPRQLRQLLLSGGLNPYEFLRDTDALRALITDSHGLETIGMLFERSPDLAEFVASKPHLARLRGPGQSLAGMALHLYPRLAPLVAQNPEMMEYPGVARALVRNTSSVGVMARYPQLLRQLPAEERKTFFSHLGSAEPRVVEELYRSEHAGEIRFGQQSLRDLMAERIPSLSRSAEKAPPVEQEPAQGRSSGLEADAKIEHAPGAEERASEPAAAAPVPPTPPGPGPVRQNPGPVPPADPPSGANLPEEAPDVYLVDFGDGRRFEVPADGTPLVIGRSPNAQIRLDDPTGLSSRRHAELRVKDGFISLRDLDSTNGTIVGNSSIRQTLLRPGDPAYLGGAVRMQVRHLTREAFLAEEREREELAREEEPKEYVLDLGEEGGKITIPPDGKRVVIGRAGDAQIDAKYDFVSRRHAEAWVENGRLRIRDLGSSNGTMILEERIEEAEMLNGDTLQLSSQLKARVRIETASQRVEREEREAESRRIEGLVSVMDRIDRDLDRLPPEIKADAALMDELYKARRAAGAVESVEDAELHFVQWSAKLSSLGGVERVPEVAVEPHPVIESPAPPAAEPATPAEPRAVAPSEKAAQEPRPDLAEYLAKRHAAHEARAASLPIENLQHLVNRGYSHHLSDSLDDPEAARKLQEHAQAVFSASTPEEVRARYVAWMDHLASRQAGKPKEVEEVADRREKRRIQIEAGFGPGLKEEAPQVLPESAPSADLPLPSPEPEEPKRGGGGRGR